MSDEVEKKEDSPPPSETDEIDADWGGSGEKGAAKKTETSAKDESKKAKESSSTPAKKAAPARAQEDEDEDEDDDDDDDDDENEDDDDDDEDEEDEEDEEEEARRAQRRRAAKAKASRSSANTIEDLIPDWGPWAVLGGLMFLGLLGGFGLIGGSKADAAESEDTSTKAASSAAATTTTATAARTMPSGRQLDMGGGERIEARHLLIKYQGSMRAEPTVTRTKDEAKKRAEQALAKIKKGADFATVVTEYSEDLGSAKRGGNLGPFTKDRMVKPFSDAAFALKPGETSALVETPFGYHVIQRTK